MTIIKAHMWGKFNNFEKPNDLVKLNQVLGAIQDFSIVQEVRTDIDGVISKIYSYENTGGIVKVGSPLYEITPSIGEVLV